MWSLVKDHPHFVLRGQIWPRRSKVTSTKSWVPDKRSWQKKFHLDIYNGSGVEIYILALEVKFDLWGQRSSQHKIADLIYKVGRNRMISISKSLLELWIFKVFILTSEVKFDLGGQRMIYVFTDNHEISNPWNFCRDRMTLSEVIRL